MSEGLPRYAYLGPAGTFTEAALRQVVAVGDCVDLPVSDVSSAIEAVRTGEADFAVVAIESTVEGGRHRDARQPRRRRPAGDRARDAGPGAVHARRRTRCRGSRTSDASPRTRTRGCSAGAGSRAICRTSCTSRRRPTPRPRPSSRRGGAELGFDAALVPPAAVDSYGLVAARAGRRGQRRPRRPGSSSSAHPGSVPPPTGADKTTLVVHLPDNEAGALLAMLEQFAVRGVNLSRIESRPIGDALGRYSFSLDAEGHITDERVGEAVMGLHRRCPYVRFLGSYPRADAVEPTVHLGTADSDFVGAREWLQALRGGTAT